MRNLLKHWTDAVSRAYYSIFHAAKEALASEGIFPKTHEGAIRESGSKFIKEKNCRENWIRYFQM